MVVSVTSGDVYRQLVEEEQWGYSDAQSIVLCLVATFSGCLSLYGSGSIIYGIAVRSPQRIDRLCDRGVLYLSVADICLTVTVVAGLYLMPSSTGMLWAFGNDATCSMIAFGFHISITVCWANANLALYFFGKVCRSWSEDQMQRWEPYLHGIPLVATLALGAVTVALDFGNPATLTRTCATNTSPTNCLDEDDVECRRGDSRLWAIWTIWLVLQLIPFGIALVATILVTRAVRRSVQRAPAAAALQGEQRLMRQAVLYFCAYLNTFLWPVVVAFLPAQPADVGEPKVYFCILLSLFLFPLQGFFNYLIYQPVQSMAVERLGSFGTSHRQSRSSDGSTSHPSRHDGDKDKWDEQAKSTTVEDFEQ
jgi:hypothetical protein